jgi:biotin carboxyl carrier protein
MNITSPMPGTVVSVLVVAADQVTRDQVLAVLEASE